jgi:5-methyltetrahydropteroyltriglutamate--homocysteine methyltransferase
MIDTTHVGSLPRPAALTPLLLARDAGRPYDPIAFDTLVQDAVTNAVRDQVAAGVTMVSDGELGKVGYSTYIIERLEGFGGHAARKPALDLALLPDLRRKLAAIMSDSGRWIRCTTISAASAPRSPPRGTASARFSTAPRPA